LGYVHQIGLFSTRYIGEGDIFSNSARGEFYVTLNQRIGTPSYDINSQAFTISSELQKITSGCVLAGTGVMMENGLEKPLEFFRPGDS